MAPRLVDQTSAMSPAVVPAATYRLQFNTSFTFDDATAIVDYLDRLGISHCYASSYFRAVPGSTHGYDVADPTQLNPEIGDRESYDRWVRTLRGGDRPKNAEEVFPDVSSMPRGCYEPWGIFRKPLLPRMKVSDCLKKFQTGGLRRLPNGKPFSDGSGCTLCAPIGHQEFFAGSQVEVPLHLQRHQA